jgi:RND family efflux transporter MFP subunit
LVKQKTISDNEVQSLLAEVNIDSAAIQLAEAEQQQQEARLKRHKLLAPFDGVISKKLTEAGEWVTPGDAVISLVATSNLRIDFQVPQTAYSKIKLDTPIRIRLDTQADKIHTGKITAIVPVADARARTFMIRASSNDIDMIITPGMSANGVLELDTGRKALTVSRDAILRYPDGRTTVWILNDDETVSEKLVKTGLGFAGNIVVNKGLDIDQNIIIEGNESLRDGQKVSIQQE